MFTILLHSSKTMRRPDEAYTGDIQIPTLIHKADELALYLTSLSVAQLEKAMSLSPRKAEETKLLIDGYSANTPLTPAIDAFLGDIYSGLQVHTLDANDRKYANEHLYILSGLYGVLRALDTIQPYRLEMGYKLPKYRSLYTFWGDAIARQLPVGDAILNLSAKEYTKAVFPYVDSVDVIKGTPIISPMFLTISPKTGKPAFVTVHAKIARGAFARWVIKNRIEHTSKLREFNDIGYKYEPTLSTDEIPVFVAKEFKGTGLSVRLQ